MQNNIEQLVRIALAVDVGTGDITSQLIPAEQTANAVIISRENGVMCGMDWAQEVFRQVNSDIHVTWHIKDGDQMSAGQTLCEVAGKARPILTAERLALNFLQTLSGTATIVHTYVEKLKGTKTKLLDTRKTIPGLRYAQKYAVRCGGGYNHRMGLHDAYLVKENHIAACGSISAAVSAARSQHPEKLLEIEVENLDELKEALQAKVTRIMLDNFSLDLIKETISIVKGEVELEVSGNVTSQNIRQIAETGVDYISVGAITKHLHAIDMTMRCCTYQAI